MLVVSLLLIYVALEHVKSKFLKVVCIVAGWWEVLIIVVNFSIALVQHLSHN
jgi:hypothetical protein